MKNVLIIAVLAILSTACASTSDIHSLQSQVDIIKVKQDALASDLSVLSGSIKSASKKADDAKLASEQALEMCKQINAKLDRVFKKTQFK
jgi:hypothetical protein